jgi:carbonic anhydrase
MGVFEQLLANNAAYVEREAPPPLDVRPSLELAIVTCMDSRLDVFAALGLGHGQAHVLRNAGGIITDDTIRSLALSQRRLGTRSVMLIHHEDCGLQLISEEGFSHELEEAAGERPPFAIGAFRDVDASVRASLERVRSSRFLLHRDHVRGFVYEISNGRLREVV